LVTTGDCRGAGTDGNVFLTLFGDKGDSGERKLENTGNNFERAQTNLFGFECVDLGDLKRIFVHHNNTKFGSAWFLDKIAVESSTGEKWYFLCGKLSQQL
jgi:hypothetical protein